jgi:transcriptional regulator with XRE-family HTH domain
MADLSASSPQRLRFARPWRSEAPKLGARVREIREAHGLRGFSDLSRLMAARLGRARTIERRRIAAIEAKGSVTAIELFWIAQTLNQPLESFFEQPYGKTPVTVYPSPRSDFPPEG